MKTLKKILRNPTARPLLMLVCGGIAVGLVGLWGKHIKVAADHYIPPPTPKPSPVATPPILNRSFSATPPYPAQNFNVLLWGSLEGMRVQIDGKTYAVADVPNGQRHPPG